MSDAINDAKEDIIECVFAFIDRMNDVCDQDSADRILNDFTAKMNPIIQEYLELRFPQAHLRQQLWLEFRTPEEIAAREARARKWASAFASTSFLVCPPENRDE